MEYRFIRACRGEPVEATPIWIMRQAGRYMPEYRKIREKVSFLELCKTPELAAEVTLQPIDYLGVDAAILFSDILIPVEAMGLELDFTPAPVFADPVRSRRDVERLAIPDPVESVPFVMETVRILRRELEGRVPLIGFSGSPFTLACYMIEGGGSKNFINLKMMMFQDPPLFEALMKKLAEVVFLYLLAQVEAGAQAVQIFDTWGGLLSPGDYARFDLPYTAGIIRRLKEEGVPIIYYVGDGSSLLELSAEAGADVLGIDWRIDMGRVRERLGRGVALQGNLDPAALFSTEEDIRRRAQEIIDHAGTSGHIFNLGHGILPPTPPENARALVEFVHEYSAARIEEET
jgi:uroporphyrinogen decarboxylase